MSGHQRCTSPTQLDSVDRGPITMKGPWMFMLRRCAKSPMVCTCNCRLPTVSPTEQNAQLA